MLFTEKPISRSPPEPWQEEWGNFPLILKALMTKGRKEFSREKGNILAFISSFLHKGKIVSTCYIV